MKKIVLILTILLMILVSCKKDESLVVTEKYNQIHYFNVFTYTTKVYSNIVTSTTDRLMYVLVHSAYKDYGVNHKYNNGMSNYTVPLYDKYNYILLKEENKLYLKCISTSEIIVIYNVSNNIDRDSIYKFYKYWFPNRIQ